MISLRLSVLADLDYLKSRAEPPVEDFVLRQIRDGRLQIIESDERPVGLIKSYLLWDRLPFMEVIWLEEAKRGLGLGTRAVRLWEEGLIQQGFDLAIISTQEERTAQQFWRKIGYADCGILRTWQRPTEIFMQRILVR